jgi:fibronectin-binding autotransporter adhesin
MFRFSRRSRAGRSVHNPKRFRPQVLQLEDRVVPSTTILVNTTADETTPNDGLTSLREAVQEASTLGDSVTIVLATGTYAIGPTNLSFQVNPLAGLDLTIQGNGPSGQIETLILGNGLDRVFTVTGNNSGVHVTFNDLSIKGGQTTTGNGGGVDLTDNGTPPPNANSLIFNDCMVFQNTANGEGSEGGGIWTDSGSITLSGSIVYNNSSGSDGGGVGSGQGNITLSSSTVYGNVSGRDGGGVFLSSSAPTSATVTVENNSHVDGNTAGGFGGGIADESAGTLTIGSGLFSDVDTVNHNVAEDAGGGVLADDASVIIRNSEINFNSSNASVPATPGGGGLADDNAAGTGTLDISGSVLSDNRVTNGPGGAILNGFGSTTGAETIHIVGSALNDDATTGLAFEATSGGGVLRDNHASSVTIIGSDLSGNRADAGNGGVLDLDGSTAAVILLSQDTFINDYAAGNGGAVDNNNGASLTLDSDFVYHDFAGSAGGGVDTHAASVSVLNSVLDDNLANSGAGGALEIFGTTLDPQISGSIVDGNIAHGNGGGVDFNGGTLGALTIVGSDFSNDAAQGSSSNGGGVNFSGGTLGVQTTSFTGDYAGNDGGGAASTGGATINVAGSVIENDTAGNEGGGLYVDLTAGTLTVDHSFVSGNVAVNQGGGLWTNDGDVTIKYSIFLNDAAANGGGMAMAYPISAETVCWMIQYSTIAFDHAGNSADGGGILTTGSAIVSGNLEVLDSTIAGNTAGGNGGGVALDGSSNMLVADFLFATLDSNSAGGDGGGIYNAQTGTAVNLGNTIVADNSAPTGPDLSGAFADLVLTSPNVGDTIGHNIIGTTTGYTGLTNGTAGDQLGVNPLLNPIANNGGPTLTNSLQAGSPAVDAGKSDADVQAVTTQDQRGVTRPDGGGASDNPDIGAFESNLG